MGGTRAELAAAEAQLVRSLLAGGPMPEGFDAMRVRAASASLRHKRARAVARAWSDLARELGPRFADRFGDYVTRVPSPPPGGPLVDGWLFAQDLTRRGQLPAAAKGDLVAFDLTHRVCEGRIQPRRFFAKVALLGAPRRLVFGVCVPWAEPRWWSLRLGR